MRSSTIVLAVGLIATPLALLANPQSEPITDGLMELAQNTIAPVARSAPDQSIDGRPLTDAPVPDLPVPGVAPADRAGGAGSRDLVAGPVNATPFSAAPTSNMQAGSAAQSNAAGTLTPTPNLGR